MLPIDILETSLVRLAQSPKLQAQVFAHAAYPPVQYPLWEFAWGNSSLPFVYVFAGVHGDEPAGIAAAVSLLELLADGAVPMTRYRLLIYPCLNPSGYALGTRGNGIGQDINRQFYAGFTQETAALRRRLNPSATMLIDLHTDPYTEGYYFFELCRPEYPSLADDVRSALTEAGSLLEQHPFFAGYWGWRGLFDPDENEMEDYLRTVTGQSLGEWGWAHHLPRSYSMEAPYLPEFERSAAMHLTALFALFSALEREAVGVDTTAG